MKTEVIKYANSKETTIMRESLLNGKKILKAEGYIQCPNNLFMRKDDSIAYYSESKKYWVFEVKTK